MSLCFLFFITTHRARTDVIFFIILLSLPLFILYFTSCLLLLFVFFILSNVLIIFAFFSLPSLAKNTQYSIRHTTIVINQLFLQHALYISELQLGLLFLCFPKRIFCLYSLLSCGQVFKVLFDSSSHHVQKPAAAIPLLIKDKWRTDAWWQTST